MRLLYIVCSEQNGLWNKFFGIPPKDVNSERSYLEEYRSPKQNWTSFLEMDDISSKINVDLLI